MLRMHKSPWMKLEKADRVLMTGVSSVTDNRFMLFTCLRSRWKEMHDESKQRKVSKGNQERDT
jgi:hypothetical protein